MTFDRGLSVGLFVFSSWALYLSRNIPPTGLRQAVGAEVLPTAISLCLMVCAVALFIRTLGVRAAVSSMSSDSGEFVGENHRAQVMVIVGLVAYLLLLEPLGFLIATCLFCAYEASLFQPEKWVRNILIGVAFSVTVYGLFVNILEVLLPVGLFGW